MKDNSVITLTLTASQQKKLYEAWADTASVKVPSYARWQLRPENCVITCYTSGKVVFQGKDASVYTSPFTVPQEEPSSPDQIFPQAGSDEVGTGDYFGPVCVCACIVTDKTAALLQKAGARDSKQIKDDDIRKIAAEVTDIIPHSLLIVSPEKYNQVHTSMNMNAIKASLHNQAYVNLRRRYGSLPSFCIIDQFAEEPVYYHYLRNTSEVIRPIHFETKAEDKYPSVGIASVLARNAFLKYMDEAEKLYDLPLHKGGGSIVDQDGIAFAEKYGFEALGRIAKLHFKNTERIKAAVGK